MKYKKICLLCVFLFLPVVLWGCGSPEEKMEPEESVVTQEAPSTMETDSIQAESNIGEGNSEPIIAIQDFDTFAAQEGSEEINLVVWNESAGTQEILEPYNSGDEVYKMQDGDRLAVNTQCGSIFLRGIRIEKDIVPDNWLAEDGTVMEKYVELQLGQVEARSGTEGIRIILVLVNKDNNEVTHLAYLVSK